MAEDIGHECGFALVRLLKPADYYLDKYDTHFFGLNRMHLMMEKQRNRGQDGAGLANVKLDMPPGKKYIHCEKSVASDCIADLFERVRRQGVEKLEKAPETAQTTNASGKRVAPWWVKQEVTFSGEVFLGHVRYGTDSDNSADKCHPVTRESNWMTRNLLLAGNFNITNNEDLFSSLVRLGQHPRDLSDTVTLLEKIGHFVDKENNDLYVDYSAAGYDPRTCFSLIAEHLNMARILRRASADWDGGYCIAGMFGHGDCFVMRDPSGIRPAYYYADDEVVVVASEAAVIQSVFEAREECLHPIPPGHALCVKRNGGWTVEKVLEPLAISQCSFERIYFSRGNDADVHREREWLGRLLFRPLLRTLELCGASLLDTVLSFIPNTSELAFYGLVKEAQEHLNRDKEKCLAALGRGELSEEEKTNLSARMLAHVRLEKVVHKDAKIRTFIQETSSREKLTMHAYDLHYGTIQRNKDNLVVIDDSLVRGNTLQNAILGALDRMGPKRIIVVSSCPQIRYPDVYGIDMAKLGDLAAFKAAVALLRERGLESELAEVYTLCKAELGVPLGQQQIANHVRRIYKPFTPQEISDCIARQVKPSGLKAEVSVLYQTIEDLHRAMPEYSGDWYFSGNYPTLGGAKACCRAFVLWFEGSDSRCYGVSSAVSHARDTILVLGGGGREHALASALAKSVHVRCVYVAPGNGGIVPPEVNRGEVVGGAPIAALGFEPVGPDFENVIEFCQKENVKLVVVSPAEMLAAGMADKLRAAGLTVFGPTKDASEIHSSKVFARQFMLRHKISMPECACFHEGGLDEALRYVQSVDYQVVVKASGMTDSTGNLFPDNVAEAEEAVKDCLARKKYGSDGESIVVERLYEGTRCSIMALTDGERVAVFPPAQLEKGAFDGDRGGSTPGMGCFAPTPAVTPRLLETIERESLRPIIDGLKAEGRTFVGCLFVEILVTESGHMVIDINCTFGDPETQALVPLLDCDLHEKLLCCVHGQLSNPLRVLSKISSVSVVMACKGYPGPVEVGQKITGLDRALCVPDVSVFHMATEMGGASLPGTPDSRSQSSSNMFLNSRGNPLDFALWRRSSSYTVATSGGRVLAVTALGRRLIDARERAYVAVRSISFGNATFRTDIASGSVRSLPKETESGPTYRSAGVDLHAHEALNSKLGTLMIETQRLACEHWVPCPHGFSGMCDVGALQYANPQMLCATSSVGTKMRIAELLRRPDTIGVDLVALCVNDLAARGAEPVFFCNHHAASQLDAHASVQTMHGVVRACKEARCALLGTDTAVMPGFFQSNCSDLVGFAVGVMEGTPLPQKNRMSVGDVVIGLPSSGLHSNGFSLIRKMVPEAKMSTAAPFDSTQSFGDVLLTPTRIYAGAVLALAKAGKMKGAAPVTGGGLLSISRVLPQELQAVLTAHSWKLPAVIRWLGMKYKISEAEMAATFNCGIGMVLIVSPEDKDEAMRMLQDFQEHPVVIGALAARGEQHEHVRIEGAATAWQMLQELQVSMSLEMKAAPLDRLFVLGGGFDCASLQAIVEVLALQGKVVGVATAKPQMSLVSEAALADIPCHQLGYVEDTKLDVAARQRQLTERVDAVMCGAEADVVIFMDDFHVARLAPSFLDDWNGRIIAVQASLALGVGVPLKPLNHDCVDAVLRTSQLVTGCTVFEPSPEGVGAILAQEVVRVQPDDSAETLRARIMTECTARALPSAVQQVLARERRRPRSPKAGSSARRESRDVTDRGDSEVKLAPRSGDAARYEQRGVSADKGDVHAAIKCMDKGLFPRAFCKVVPDTISGDEGQAIVMHADGAGTKSSLAYMYWKKTGDLSVWKGVAQDAIVMNLDDLLCVGVTDKILLSSTIGRNKTLIPREVIGAVISGTEEFVRELGEHGVGIVLTGGETADVGDLVRTIIVDSTVTAQIPRDQVIDNGRISAGDVIVGLSSSGQATYESAYNSGIGSNGLTAARHDTFHHALAEEYPESFDPLMPAHLVYSGGCALEEGIEIGGGVTVPAGKLVLSPTRTYAPIVQKILASGLREHVHGMVHCSGGGQTKVLHFASGVHVVKDQLFNTPPVFRLIQQHSQTPWEEMYKVFNMGHRLEFYTDEASAASIIDISRSFNVEAQVVGRVESSDDTRLTINSQYGVFSYQH